MESCGTLVTSCKLFRLIYFYFEIRSYMVQIGLPTYYVFATILKLLILLPTSSKD